MKQMNNFAPYEAVRGSIDSQLFPTTYSEPMNPKKAFWLWEKRGYSKRFCGVRHFLKWDLRPVFSPIPSPAPSGRKTVSKSKNVSNSEKG